MLETIMSNTSTQTTISEQSIFEFEKDFAGSLRCIPMAVRFKLDHCGIKLSLRQWSHFTREDRGQLLNMNCNTPETVVEYRNAIITLIETRAKEHAEDVAVDAHPVWGNSSTVPERLKKHLGLLSLPTLTRDQWAALTPLQRFALFKLTREGHKNENFIPAMREFGILT
jgi:hypothetical protein